MESIVETKEQYHDIFAGNLSHIAEFDVWFQVRFTALQQLQDIVCVYLEDQADNLLKQEDSVSQASQPMDGWTGGQEDGWKDLCTWVCSLLVWQTDDLWRTDWWCH